MAVREPKTRMKRVLRDRTPEKIHPKTLLITGLTAATVAGISLKLTGTVSSITLVALASLLTAFISEIYRVSLEVFQKTVRRQVERILDRQAVALDSTGELHLVEEPVEPAPEPEAQLSARPLTPFSLRRRAVRVLSSRWAVPVLFAAVAFATVAGSYAVGSVTGADDVTMSREVVQVRDISQERVNELRAAAKADAAKAAEQEANEAVEEATGESSELISLTKEELVTLISDLETELATTRTTASDQATELESLQERIDTLEATLTSLTERLEALEEAPEPEQPTEEPTPNTPAQ